MNERMVLGKLCSVCYLRRKKYLHYLKYNLVLLKKKYICVVITVKYTYNYYYKYLQMY